MSGMEIGGRRHGPHRVRRAAGILATALVCAANAWAGPPAKGDVEIVHQFRALHHGAGSPAGDLVEGADGALYGAASQGGHLDAGSIFRIAPDGTYSTVAQFGLGMGSFPVGDLVTTTDGGLLGVTRFGGDFGDGVIFKIDAGGNQHVVYSFTDAYGGRPGAGLTPAPDGYFYGVVGGEYVYRVSQDGSFFAFTSLGQEGMTGCQYSVGRLVPDAEGDLFGVTPTCLYVVTPAGRARSLYTFSGSPVIDVSAGTDGNLYVTKAGEDTDGTCGSLYRFTPAGKHALVRAWTCYPTPELPTRAPVMGPDGALHGAVSRYEYGRKEIATAIYRIDTDGRYSETIVPKAAGMDLIGLMLASDGWYYGNVPRLGKGDAGSVIRTRGGD